ncbi:mannose-6-phosphate isomerase-like protein (cupin superfamily) [Microbacterium resistens]|uniref:Mannose-6-phosphate isomerase-like protein (Cupin superfamily) n=1 Tax=Microbacterium resistens TaxID=156977 RepID=A0ABU1SB45_9MICO|nr:hypothetical protein [Microbacterium resistens]MDR6866794.1 mannose-6-phosphate isomerase-like protein (cupin superfamily) [Microbacterium resistens]
MTFIPNHKYRRPTPVEVPPGQSITIPATTLHVAHDQRGREVGYVIEPDVGTQHYAGPAL